MAGFTDRLTDKEAMSFIAKIEDVFKSLPHLPTGITEFVVKVAPYLAVLGAILGFIAGPFAILGAIFATLVTLNPVIMVLMIVDVVVMIISSVLLLMAYKPLKQRELKGWVFLFWTQVLGVVTTLLALPLGMGSGAVTTVIGTLIGFYILFETKSFYGKMK
jgi:hypothetical protein